MEKSHDEILGEAYIAGKTAAECDGFMATQFLPCQCDECLVAYQKGWYDADPFDYTEETDDA